MALTLHLAYFSTTPPLHWSQRGTFAFLACNCHCCHCAFLTIIGYDCHHFCHCYCCHIVLVLFLLSNHWSNIPIPSAEGWMECRKQQHPLLVLDVMQNEILACIQQQKYVFCINKERQCVKEGGIQGRQSRWWGFVVVGGCWGGKKRKILFCGW